MKLVIDTDLATLNLEDGGEQRSMPLYSREAFEELSRQWVKVGWELKYSYTFSWLGRPIIQLPEDMIRLQEAIYRLQPDVILETGVAHGGSLIFSASLCQLLGKGRVIGVDIEIRPANRTAIETHSLARRITLIEGNSVASEVVRQVKAMIRPEEVVLVVLDSNHSREHVLAELEAYHDLVSAGSYIIATDGIMRDLHDVPQGSSQWCWDNPAAAAAEFLERHSEFVLEQPPWLFNESPLQLNVTHWPDAWLRRKQK
jgi:cephalosporin hydroxylase